MLYEVFSIRTLLVISGFIRFIIGKSTPNIYTDMEMERIEILKARITEELHIQVPSNYTKSNWRKIPPSLLKRARAMVKQTEEKPKSTTQYQNKEEKMLFMPKSGFICSHNLADACLKYDTEDLPQNAAITNASLWFFKTNRRAQNFTLTIISDTTGISGKIFQLYQANSHKRGWFSLQISSVLRWWQQTHKNTSGDITFKLSCDTCNSRRRVVPIMSFTTTRTPYIEATTVLKTKIRTKRYAYDCAPGTNGQCCRKPLRIAFKDVGLGNLYTIPAHFNAYYCMGSCSSAYQGSNMHGTILAYGGHASKTCCAPKEYRDQSVIYQSPHGALMKHDLKNIVVSKCGCA